MHIDTLIHARWIIPIEPDAVTYENHSLAIGGGKIVDLLPTGEARQKYSAAYTADLRDHALIPGLINCHTHAAMTLFRGIADDLQLADWLQNHIWPLEQQWVGEAFVKDGTDLAIAEMLRGGTTCFQDMYFFPEIVAQQAKCHGIRACIGLIVIDFPTVWGKNSDDYLEKGLALHERLSGEPLITTAFAPHAPYTVSDGPLQKIRSYSDKLGLRVHIHLHETRQEIERSEARSGIRPLQRLKELGLVGPRMVAVHMTQLTNSEKDLLQECGVHVVHCPESNMKLASGFCPVAELLERKVNVALGTDGAASNNDLDMFGEMRTAALLAKAVANDASVVSAMTALKMATLHGAKALGIERETGSLVVGKAADVVAIDLTSLETQPLYHPASQIVYAAGRRQVSDVWVAGKHLLKQGELATFDLVELNARIGSWRQRLVG